MDLPEWKLAPTVIEQWPDDISHVIFMDENGSPETKSIAKAIKENYVPEGGNRYFNVAAVLMNYEEFKDTRHRFSSLKAEFWDQGLFFNKKYNKYEKVCLHTKDISNGHDAFDSKIIDRELLFSRISEEIEASQFIIVDAYIDKYLHFLKYIHAEDPYVLALAFILERISRFHLKEKDKAIIILESRGYTEDKLLLSRLIYLFNNGALYIDRNVFEKIYGVYFNPKWSKNRSNTYIGLEIADLCAFPIYKYCKYGTVGKNFISIREKLSNYPFFGGIGIKKFP